MNERGQSLVEYLLLLCLVSATTIGVMSVVGQNIREQYEKASAAIRGENPKAVKFTKPKDSQTRARGMSDWEDGTERIE